LSCQLNDVYHISEIEDITKSTHRNDDQEFIIKQDRGRPVYALSSQKRDVIIQAIKSSKVILVNCDKTISCICDQQFLLIIYCRLDIK
jgi:hypothetical protein